MDLFSYFMSYMGYDVERVDNKVIYKLKLPGVEKEHVKLDSESDRLTLEISEGEYKGKYFLKIAKGYESVKAALKNGILSATVEYPAPIKNSITIE